MKQIEDTNKWKDNSLYSQIERIYVHTTKVTQRFQAIPIKIPMAFSTDTDETGL